MFLLGLLLPICFVPGYTGASIPSQWALLSVALPIALWHSHPSPWLLTFLGYALVSSMWAASFYTTTLGLWYVGIWTLSFALGSSLPSLCDLWKGLAIGLSISSLVALSQALGYESVEVIEEQYAGLLFNSTVQGTCIALVLIALASHRLWWYMPVLVLGLILAGSRGSFLILALAVAVRYTHWLFALACLIFGSLAYTFAVDPADTQRLIIWGQALRGLSFFGWGPDSFNDIYYMGIDHATGRPTVFHAEFVHNDYLQLIFEYGIGASFVFGVYAIAAVQTRSADWPVLFAFLCLSTFYFPLYTPITAFIGAVVTGHLLRDRGVVRYFLRRCRLVFLSRYTFWQFAMGGTGFPPVSVFTRDTHEEG